MAAEPPVTTAADGTSRLALFARFLRFGLLAWGGPVAQIAMLRRELVEEQRWIDGGRFNRLLAVFQVLPGPEATELAVHLGFLRAGRLGGLLAGLGFVLPGFALMLLLAWLYFLVDLTQAAIGAALLGIQVAVVAMVVRAVGQVGRHVLVDPLTWLIAIAAGLATLGRVPFWLVLPVAGIAAVLDQHHRRPARLVLGTAVIVAAAYAVVVLTQLSTLAPPVPAPTVADRIPGGEAAPVELLLSGLTAGLLTFGGAYTAIPFLRGDAVGSGWLSDGQFLDGLALGGILPAPLIIFSTFVGYVAGGLLGAVAMTVGVFLPAFAFSLVLGHRLEAVVQNPALRRLLDGVAAGVVGIIAVTAIDLGLVVLRQVPSPATAVVIFAAALLLLVVWKSKAAIPVVIGLGAIAGFVAFQSPG